MDQVKHQLADMFKHNDVALEDTTEFKWLSVIDVLSQDIEELGLLQLLMEDLEEIEESIVFSKYSVSVTRELLRHFTQTKQTLEIKMNHLTT